MRTKNWKRITAGALSICMMATCAPSLAELGGILQAPVTVHAETSDVIVTGNCGDHANWNYNRTTKVMTITGSGTANLFLNYSIARYKTEVKQLIFSDGITEIHSSSFENFTALEDIQFGGVKTIAYQAFKGCTSLKTLNLDANIEEIGAEAFCDCKNLTTVTVGAKVKTAYEDIFKGCDNLTSISISKDNEYLCTDGKELLSSTISRKCGKNVTFSYNSKTKTLTLSGNGAMYEGDYYQDEDSGDYVCITPFSKDPYEKIITNEMQTLVVGDNITSIGNSNFQNCTALKTVKLGKKVSNIGKYAFAGCSNLNKISSSTNLTKIGNYAFSGCKKLKTFSIGKALKTIGDGAFSECTRLSKLSVHKNNKYFSKRDNMLLNKSQSKIVSACFGSNKTCNVYSSVKSIDKTIIEDSSVKYFSVSKNNAKYSSKNGLLYSKNGKTLKRCPAKMSGIVNIGDTVTSVDRFAFCNCNNITQINIGKNMEKIDFSSGYFSAEKLNKIQVSNKNKYYYEANGSIISKATDELIYCYKTDGDTYTIPESVKKISGYAFRSQNNLTHIILSDNVTELGSFPTNIESIHLGNSCKLSSFNNYIILDNLESLKEVTVSSEHPDYTSIDGVLYNKDVTKLVFLPEAIETYTMPESVTSFLGDDTIAPTISTHLKNLVLSDTITDATKWLGALYKLESVHLGKNVSTIKSQWGIYLYNLKSISVSEENRNFKAINNLLYSKDGSKFILCPAMTEGKVVLENGVTEISSYAFNHCKMITDIVIPDTVSKIDDYALGQPSTSNPELNTLDSIVIWVPKGKLDYYKSLFTPNTGFLSNMVIMELEN